MAVFITGAGIKPVLGKLASDYAVGESVFLMENGTAVEYLVVNQGIPSDSSLYDASCDGVWVLRKDCYIQSGLHTNNATNDYQNLYAHTTLLNETFYGLLDSAVQRAIQTAKIPYWDGYGSTGSVATGSNGLSTKIFLLSIAEVGLDSDSLCDGVELSYFSNGGSRQSYYNGTVVNWWTRSPAKGETGYSLIVSTSGAAGMAQTGSSRYIRPAFIIKSNTKFDPDTNIFKGV